MLFLDYLAGLNVNRSGLKQLGSEREAATGRGGAAGGPAVPLRPPRGAPRRTAAEPGRPPRPQPHLRGGEPHKAPGSGDTLPAGTHVCNVHTPGHIRIRATCLHPCLYTRVTHPGHTHTPHAAYRHWASIPTLDNTHIAMPTRVRDSTCPHAHTHYVHTHWATCTHPYLHMCAPQRAHMHARPVTYTHPCLHICPVPLTDMYMHTCAHVHTHAHKHTL